MRALANVARLLLVRHRALTVVSVLFFCSLLGAYATGFWLMSRLANVVIVVVPLAYVWSRLNLRSLEVTVDRSTDQLQVGGPFEERVTVENRGWFTKLWLEVEDASDLPGHSAKWAVTLGPHSQRSWRKVSICTRRGLYAVGPLSVATGDPLGLFRVSRTFGAAQPVLVYPRAVELPKFEVPHSALLDEGRYLRTGYSSASNVVSVREYVPGDTMSRIHWPSTARVGRLMVKLFEPEPTSDVWVVLDLQGSVQAGEGDDGTEEHAVSIAASVARYFLLADRRVGFLAHGRRYHREEPGRGLAQYAQILEALAIARAEGDVSLARLVNYEGRRFGRHTTLVTITSSTEEAWVVTLQDLKGRGVQQAAILLEPRTFGGGGDALFIFGALAAAEITTYLVKRDDDLAVALTSSREPMSESRSSR